VHGADGADRVLLVGGELLLDRRGIDPAPPVAREDLDAQIVAVGDPLPERRRDRKFDRNLRYLVQSLPTSLA